MSAPTTDHDAVAPSPYGPPRRPAGRRPAVLGAALGGLALFWLALYLAAGDGVPRGTTVDGVPIGGMSQAAAGAKIRTAFGPRADRPLPVEVAGRRLQLAPSDAGLRLDPAATVAQAGSRSWNPVTLVKALVGDHAVHPLGAVDGDQLDAGLTRLNSRSGTRAVDGDVTFSAGRVVRVTPHDGVRIDVDAAAGRVRDAYLRTGPVVVLPTETEKAAVDTAEVDRAVEEFGDPAMSGPVTLEIGATTVIVSPVAVSPALRMDPDGDHHLQPALDVAVLRRTLGTALTRVEKRGRDARFRIVSGRPVVVPSITGVVVADPALAKAVLDALASTGDRSRRLELTVAQPTLTTAAARALGVTTKVSSFTTFYPSDFRPRLINIHRAANLLSGALVKPGEVFSLNGRIGERTAARGFAQGFIINKGQLEVDFGGGVSQVATTTFNAVFFAGLQDVEHHPHSFYISRYPEGREATVAWGAKDLRFRNDSGHGIFITTAYTNRSITVTMWGTKRFTKVTSVKSARSAVKPFATKYDPRPEGTTAGNCVHQDGVVGFRVTVTRRLFQGNRVVHTDVLSTRYDPEQRIICGSTGPPPATSPTPRPTG